MSDDPRVVALLDTVIPAGGDMPAAGTLGLAASVVADAQGSAFQAGLALVLDQLPADFASGTQDDREAALHDVAEREPEAFGAVVNLVYTAYYTERAVLERIERSTGYQAGPPQPRGYQLEPFDPSLLARVQLAAHTWRES